MVKTNGSRLTKKNLTEPPDESLSVPSVEVPRSENIPRYHPCMVAIFTYNLVVFFNGKNMVSVGKYTSPMDAMGYGLSEIFRESVNQVQINQWNHTCWWFFTTPFEKYARQIGSSPQVGDRNHKNLGACPKPFVHSGTKINPWFTAYGPKKKPSSSWNPLWISGNGVWT